MVGATELVDLSMVTEVGDSNLETSVANEVEMAGPLDKPIQLQGPMISAAGKMKSVGMVVTSITKMKQRRKCM